MTPARRNYNQEWLPNLFNDFFDNDWMPKTNATAPAINVSEEDKAYKVEVAAPGMTKDDFKIYLSDDDDLVIAIEKKNESKDENKKYLRREFSYSKFQQTLVLPDDVDREQISASVNDGVLTIDLQKKVVKECNKEPKLIDIK